MLPATSRRGVTGAGLLARRFAQLVDADELHGLGAQPSDDRAQGGWRHVRPGVEDDHRHAWILVGLDPGDDRVRQIPRPAAGPPIAGSDAAMDVAVAGRGDRPEHPRVVVTGALREAEPRPGLADDR